MTVHPTFIRTSSPNFGGDHSPGIVSHHLNVRFTFAPSGNGASEKQLAGLPIGKHRTESPGAQFVRFIPKPN